MQVPPEVDRAARSAFRTRLPGSVLMTTVSVVEDPSGRGSTLRYAGDGLRVEVVVAEEDELRRLRVHVQPTMPLELAVQRADDALTFGARGRPPFEVAAQKGLTRLVLTARTSDGSPRRWQTPWTCL